MQATSREPQQTSEKRRSAVRKAAEIIATLRFLWRQSRLLPKELETTKLQPVPRAVLDAYATNKEAIETIYGSRHVRRNLLHHGTGALQYDGDKYGAGMIGRLRKPIDTILKDGLRPHADAWALTDGSALSVSFATAWSYARFYAEAHQPSDNPLEWVYGTRVGWFSYCIMGTARQSFGTALLAGNLRTLGRPKSDLSMAPVNDSYSRLQRWALDVRQDITPRTPMIDVIRARTDIPANFGVIITVTEKDVPLAPMGLGGTYEKRSARPIRPDEFTSLAVPLNKVEEYTAKVHDLGYSFPVLPIEAVEYHMAHFPVQELARAQRVA
jgi:hypothetical protein